MRQRQKVQIYCFRDLDTFLKRASFFLPFSCNIQAIRCAFLIVFIAIIFHHVETSTERTLGYVFPLYFWSPLLLILANLASPLVRWLGVSYCAYQLCPLLSECKGISAGVGWTICVCVCLSVFRPVVVVTGLHSPILCQQGGRNRS